MFPFGDKVVLSCDSKKEREVIFNIVPLWSTRATPAESVRAGALLQEHVLTKKRLGQI